ncbi:YHYH protein [Ekhidna sp.]|uniref:YHYH protein n=1 Tax=Ekhidna sp. TaxID=2608089 RepID=UPI0032973ACF
MKQFHFTKITSFIVLIFILPSCGEDEDPVVDETSYTVSIDGNSEAAEGDNTGFKVTLNPANDSGNDLTISYVVSGSASSNMDYEALNGTASLIDGESEVSVPIIIIDDSEKEDDETIIITLSPTGLASNVSLGSSLSLTITITDNDDNSSGSCANDNSISNQNVACDLSPNIENTYDDNTVNQNGLREIVTNGVPNHHYANQLSGQGVTLSTSTKTYFIAGDPAKSATTTSITNDQNRPNYRFGIAKNGVPLDPAPAEPFIFENTNTGEYNWDWVFEPTNNAESVGLDCAFAHVQPDGTYHYHGNMIEYANTLLAGLGDGSATPSEAIQIGWAADGFPVYYKYAPTANGNEIEQLASGYALKQGERPGDGVTEPCGEYNGKYTNDYEWSASNGDLDECNGIDRSVTIENETYEYFYVITEEFPVIPRCLVGTPDNTFKLGM